MDSPASNGGRGLKHANRRAKVEHQGFARQQWRARIETVEVADFVRAIGIRPPAMAGAD